MNIRSAIIALGAATLLVATGCTSNKKYAALQSRYDQLTADYNSSQVALAESNSNSTKAPTLECFNSSVG